MTGQHAHTRIHPTHKHKPLEYCHIIIDGTGTKWYATPAKYEQEVLFHLRSLRHSRTGQAVFGEFERRSHHLMKIVPVEKDPKEMEESCEEDPCAYTEAKYWPPSFKKGELAHSPNT